MGIWLSRNANLFQGTNTLSLKCVTRNLNILSSFPQFSSSPPRNNVSGDNINEETPWTYFDGASQGTPSKGWVGGLIFFFPNHTMSFKVGIGEVTNNYSELLPLELVLILALQKRFSQIQILGDSLLFIQWITGDFILRNFLLQPLH